jgi:hypothetical protein
MTGNLLVSLLVVPCVEYFFRVPFTFQAQVFLNITKKSMRLVASRRISDHWKEIVLLRYAKDLMLATLCLAFILLGFLLLMGIGAIFFDWWLNPKPSTMSALLTPWGWASMTLTAMMYLYFRKRFVRS